MLKQKNANDREVKWYFFLLFISLSMVFVHIIIEVLDESYGKKSLNGL